MGFKQNRAAGFAIIAVVYVVAAALAVVIFNLLLGQSIFLRVFWADIAATLLVYLAGFALGNASVYDPYWSVAPIVATVGLCIYYRQWSPGTLLLLAVIAYWGIRLTTNWAITFHGLNKQDWRYDKFRHGFPKLYPIISLGGIHLVPTLVVYLALLPAIAFIQYGGTMNGITVLGGCHLRRRGKPAAGGGYPDAPFYRQTQQPQRAHPHRCMETCPASQLSGRDFDVVGCVCHHAFRTSPPMVFWRGRIGKHIAFPLHQHTAGRPAQRHKAAGL